MNPRTIKRLKHFAERVGLKIIVRNEYGRTVHLRIDDYRDVTLDQGESDALSALEAYAGSHPEYTTALADYLCGGLR